MYKSISQSWDTHTMFQFFMYKDKKINPNPPNQWLAAQSHRKKKGCFKLGLSLVNLYNAINDTIEIVT